MRKSKHIYLTLAVVFFLIVFSPEALMADWESNPGPQTIVLTRLEFEILFGGARGGGKTEAGIAWLVEPEYVSNRRYRGLVIRKNTDDLSDWIARAKEFYIPLRARFTGKPPLIRFPSGAFIRTGHLKDKNAYTKYQGHEYQKILVEELTQIPRETDYEMLISSARSTVPGLKSQVLCTTNPGGAGHVWVKARWVDVARNKTYWANGISRIFIPATMDDNPKLMEADPLYVKRIESIKDEKLRSAWRYGDWDTFSGQFFEKWNSTKHVVKPFKIPETWLKFRGLDWGYTAPTAVNWVAVDFSGNHYVYREYYESGKSPSIVARRVLSMTDKKEQIVETLASPDIWARNQYVTGKNTDQQTRKSIFDFLQNKGLHCRKANNDRINGWMAMKELMYWDENIEPRFFVFDNCEHTIRTLPGLIHDDNDVEDMNKGGEDHLAEDLRYVCMHTVNSVVPETEKSKMEEFIEKITKPAEEQFNWDDY